MHRARREGRMSQSVDVDESFPCEESGDIKSLSP